MPVITREYKVEQSVTDFLRSQLFSARGLPPAEVMLHEAFEYKNFSDQPLDKEYVTLGFNFDQGGRPAELGSDLTILEHNIEIWVFATTPERGSNLAAQIQAGLGSNNGTIPLKDYAQNGDPVIDQLIVVKVKKQRQPHPDPEPWQENAWTVTLVVQDEFFANSI